LENVPNSRWRSVGSTTQPNPAFIVDEVRKGIQNGRLAATRRPQQADELSVSDAKRDAIEDLQVLTADPVVGLS
jgi:hypothetical protein